MKRTILFSLFLVCCLVASAQAKPVVSILGDSYSSYEGYIPRGNEPYYFEPWRDQRTDVNDVKQMWWWQVISEGGYKLGVNDAYSGATICYTGYDNRDYRDRSFITRTDRLGSPDIILVLGGTNDAWAHVPLGEYKYEKYALADLYTFRPAMARMMQLLQNHYPGTRIYMIVNDGLDKAYTESMTTVCKKLGIKTIMLHDIDKKGNHPSIVGMKQVARQVLDGMK